MLMSNMNINNMNEFIQMARNSNPQQLVMGILQQRANENPLFANILSLAQNGNTAEIENIVRNMAAQNAACCCDIQRQVERGFADTNYNMATQDCQTRQVISNSTRDIIDNQNASTRAILDFLTQDKISTLQAENQSLKFQASQTAQNAYLTANQSAQTAELIRRLGADCPVPAYIVPNPNCCYSGCNYNYSGCGCC